MSAGMTLPSEVLILQETNVSEGGRWQWYNRDQSKAKP